MTTLAFLSSIFFFVLLIVMKKANQGRAIWPFFLVALPGLVLSLIYVGRSWTDVVFLDGFIQVPIIGQFMAGHLPWGELLQPRGEHVLLGYGLFSLFNARFLGLDMRLDPVAFALSFLLLSGVVYLEFSKALKTEKSWLLTAAFLPLALIGFSLTAPPLMLMATQFSWGASLAVLVGWLLQKEFDRPPGFAARLSRPLLGALLGVVVYYLVFSGSYFPGLLFGLAGMIIFRCAAERQKPDWRAGTVILTAVICSSLYVYRVFVVEPWPESVSMSQRISHLVNTPRDTFLTYLAGIGAGVVDGHSVENNMPALLYLGGAMLLITGFAFWLFFKARMHRATYLPIFCIFYTLGVISAVRLGRGQIGDWRWIANEWYSFHLRLLCLGVTWILIFAIVGRWRARSAEETADGALAGWKVLIALASLAFIFTSHGFANYRQWNRGLGIRGWAEEKRRAMLYPEFTDQSVLLWPPTETAAARSVLEKYHLSSFSIHSLKDFFAIYPDGLIRFTGWGQDNWVAGNGSASFFSGKSGDVAVVGQLPPFIPSAKVDVFLNGKPIFSGKLSANQITSFAGKTQRGLNILTIQSNQSVAPAKAGSNGDMRPVSLHVNAIRLPRG